MEEFCAQNENRILSEILETVYKDSHKQNEILLQKRQDAEWDAQKSAIQDLIDSLMSKEDHYAQDPDFFNMSVMENNDVNQQRFGNSILNPKSNNSKSKSVTQNNVILIIFNLQIFSIQIFYIDYKILKVETILKIKDLYNNQILRL